MRKIVAIVVAVLMSAPTELLAQGLTATTKHGPLLTAALAEASRLEGSLSNAAAVQSPSPPDAWDQLQTMPAGTRVRLTLMKGAEIEGRLVQATPDALVLAESQLLKGSYTTPGRTSLRDQQTFRRTDVVRVQTRTQSWFGRHPVLAGALVGSAVGVLLGSTGTPNDMYSAPEMALIGCGFFAGIGAAVGLIIVARRS
jgi:hypothetical protein